MTDRDPETLADRERATREVMFKNPGRWFGNTELARLLRLDPSRVARALDQVPGIVEEQRGAHTWWCWLGEGK